MESKKGKGEKDDRVKKPLTAYMLYSAKRRKEIKDTDPSLLAKDVMKKIAQEWKGLEETEKKEFQDIYDKNKLEYDSLKQDKNGAKPKKTVENKPQIKKKPAK